MTRMDEIVLKIEEIRQLMHGLMDNKALLTDPELVALSQKLDGLLNEYNKLTCRKI
ncbi:aspartyl-phosphate phosphatase Spo0E family protein [Clostridium akagii]|uniref:aspartyl-phosphate phosphatase Spo0E family protein n=1 Tax=Clostridium akagii TaxID=91623 RepID=UPI00047EB8B1|nr:aspartyl-phosphate phosphatase Spo0E family protein [Clostridium akagii]